jgi:hypothetical protein
MHFAASLYLMYSLLIYVYVEDLLDVSRQL